MDDVQPRFCRIQGRDAWCPMQHAPGIAAAVMGSFERERTLMGHPARERLKPAAQLRVDPEERCPWPATKPFEATADVDVDAEGANVDGDSPHGLVAVNDGHRAHASGLRRERGDCR